MSSIDGEDDDDEDDTDGGSLSHADAMSPMSPHHSPLQARRRDPRHKKHQHKRRHKGTPIHLPSTSIL